MTSSGSSIAATDFVTIQDKAQSLLGTGTGSRGYGQTVLSADVYSGNIITKAQWDALRYDIINVRFHQDGVLPSIATVNVGDPIQFGAGSPNSNFDTLLETAIANRFNVASNQSTITAKGTATTSSSFSTSASFTVTATFASANAARYFFNSGGKIRITPTFSGSISTAQVNAWTNFINSVGTRSFGANTDPYVNYYTLTNSYQIYYQGSLSTPYSANNYRMEAKVDVANNSAGTASVLYLKVTLNDSYVDPGLPAPGDLVSGTLTFAVSELKALGVMQPSGTFAITSPTYSLSSISVS